MTVVHRISGTPDSPELRFHVSPTYALYHWLRACHGHLADDRLRPALNLIAGSLNQRGPRGIAGPWEEALAAADGMDASMDAFQARIQATGDAVVTAMRSTERIFIEEHWPAQSARIDDAMDTIRSTFEPGFPGMAREHAELLNLDWPLVIDVHLLGAMDGDQGAYSHPLTIDVSQHAGLTLCETLLHESTHVADVNGMFRNHRCLGDRLQAFLGEHGLSPVQRFNVWHAVIFASSAARIRSHVGDGYPDYAAERGLYRLFGVPGIAELWSTFEVNRDEARLFEAIRDEVREDRRRPGPS